MMKPTPMDIGLMGNEEQMWMGNQGSWGEGMWCESCGDVACGYYGSVHDVEAISKGGVQCWKCGGYGHYARECGGDKGGKKGGKSVGKGKGESKGFWKGGQYAKGNGKGKGGKGLNGEGGKGKGKGKGYVGLWNYNPVGSGYQGAC